MEDVGTEDIDHEKAHEEDQVEAMERSAAIEPFGDEVSEGDTGAPKLEEKIAIDDNLRGRSGVGTAKEFCHFV